MDEWLLPFLPTGLMMLGQRLQRRDSNATGADDVIGRAIISAAPLATLALSNTDDQAALRALKATREGIDAAIKELEAEKTPRT